MTFPLRVMNLHVIGRISRLRQASQRLRAWYARKQKKGSCSVVLETGVNCDCVTVLVWQGDVAKHRLQLSST